MARVQYGSIVTALKGNVGGQTFQNGNHSQVLRQKGYRAGPRTIAQQSQKIQLSMVAGAWRNLTSEQRSAWEAAVESWPFIDKWGNPYTGNGYQMFMAYNTTSTAENTGIVTTPGTPITASPIGTPTWSELNQFHMTFQISAGDENYEILDIFACAPYSPGQKPGNQRFRFLKYDTRFEQTDYSIHEQYQAIFGIPPDGSTIAVRILSRNYLWPKAQLETLFIGQVVYT